jgi:HlyD family secretion protein
LGRREVTVRFWLKTLGILLLLAVLVGGPAYGTWRLAKKKYAPPAALKVRIEAVTAGALAESISATGIVLPRKSVKISAKVSARIMALPVKEGDTVSAGRPDAIPPVPATVLLRLDDRDLLSRRRAAEAGRAAMAAQLEVDKASLDGQRAEIVAQEIRLEQSERDLQRKTGLLQSKDIAPAVFDDADSACREAKARLQAARHRVLAAEGSLRVLGYRIDAAEADIEQAQEALSYTTITAPIDGTVTSLNAQVGEMVVTGTMNNAGTVILEVADLASMIVVAEIDEADIGKVAVGQPADIHVQAYPDTDLRGEVEIIALMHRLSNRGTRYYRTEVRLVSPAVALYSGLTANLDIRTRVHEGVLTVPSQAVVGRKLDELPEAIRKNRSEVESDKTYATVVYRVRNGRTLVTPVRIGAADMARTEVVSGLAAGDLVVVGPYKVLDTLAHDREVEVGETGEAATSAAPAAAGRPPQGGRPRGRP